MSSRSTRTDTPSSSSHSHPKSPTHGHLSPMGRGSTKKSSSSGELFVGAEAELRSDDPGFHGSFYEVTITVHLTSSGQYTVVYSTLVADDGGPLVETVAASNVRPRPPRAGRRRGFEVHEAVEAFHNEGWWAGVVTAVQPSVAGAPRMYKVAFPTSRETMEFEETALRPHRVFQAERWVPAADVGDGRHLFPEGTQVEVSWSAKSFGKSWRPASVMKVIGASYFLVKYTHIGHQGESATEIVDSQYIRPAYTARKYMFSQSSRVEVMHEGSWRPCVIMEVLGGGIDKYVVKLESYETNVEDVECLDVLTVENTQLRLQVCWDGKTWLRRLEEKSASGPMLASRKRPISCGLPLQKEVGETSDEHGSNREKKLKNADVVSEPIPHISSACNESSEIKCNSSSYPGETVKQGNAVLAPPSLPLTGGFAHLSDSSLAQSSHPEQASSEKIIKPSALAAPQSRQLQASLFRTFGQPRPLPQGPVSGMQSLNSPPKDVMAAKTIEEAINSASTPEDLEPKNGDDNVELLYNVTAGCGTLSETNTVNCVEPTTTPNDIRGSQHAVSQQGHGSEMDDRLSESSAIKHFPFASQVRARIEAMEIFSEMPQRPNLNHLQRYCPELREGMALGLMLTFAILAESINMINIHQEDIGEVVQKKKQALYSLEENGFDVRALRSRLEARLSTTR